MLRIFPTPLLLSVHDQNDLVWISGKNKWFRL